MHVPRGHHRNAQLLPQADNGAVQLPQSLVVGHLPLPHQEGVVADGLNLQVIVEPGDLLELVPAFPGQHRAEKLPGLAGAAHDEPLPVLLDEAPGHVGAAAEIVQVTNGYQAVEVLHALLGFHQQDDMEALPDGPTLESFVEAAQGVDAPLPGLLVHFGQAQGGGGGVVDGPVGVFQAHAQVLAHAAQLVALHVGVELAGKGEGVQHRRLPLQPQPPQLRPQQGSVIVGVVGRDGAIPDEFHELGDGGLRGLLVGEHHVGDAGDLGNLGLEGLLGVHQDAQGVRHRAPHQLHRADFNDPGGIGVQPRGLKVQDDDRLVKVPVVRVLDDLRLVDEVALAAGDELDILALHGIEGRREGLHHPVVGDGHGGMPPLDGPLDEVSRGGQGVHGGHVGVHMQLHALFLGGVLPLHALHGHHVPHGNGQLMGEVVVEAFPAHLHVHAHLDLLHLVHNGLALLGGDGFGGRVVVLLAAKAVAVAQEGLAQDGGGIVRDGKGQQQQFPALELLGFQLEDVPLHGNQARVAGELLHLHGALGDGPAQDGLAQGMVGHHGGQGRPGLGLGFGLVALLGGLALPLFGGFLPGLLFRGRALLQLGQGIGLLLGLAALLPQGGQPCLLIPGHGQLHLHLDAEDVLHRLHQPCGHPLPAHELQGKGVREGQGNPLPVAAPVHLIHPADGGGIIPLEEVHKHLLVVLNMRQEILSQGGADHPQGQGALGEHLPQHPFHFQEGGLLHQHVALEGDVHLPLGLHVDHVGGVQLPLELGQLVVNLRQ